MNDSDKYKELHEKMVDKFGVNYKFWMTQGLGGVFQSKIKNILVIIIKAGVDEDDLMDLINSVIISRIFDYFTDEDILKCIIKDAIEEAKNER